MACMGRAGLGCLLLALLLACSLQTSPIQAQNGDTQYDYPDDNTEQGTDPDSQGAAAKGTKAAGGAGGAGGDAAMNQDEPTGDEPAGEENMAGTEGDQTAFRAGPPPAPSPKGAQTTGTEDQSTAAAGNASEEDNSAGAAFAPGYAPPGYYNKYNFTSGWKKIKGGDVGPETIIGAAIGAVLGMSFCICFACVCYIRQRNIARAQYGPAGGGAIEL